VSLSGQETLPKAEGSNMSYALQVLDCQRTSCRSEIVLPFLAPVENFPLVPSTGGDPYLDVACPECSHVFRYTGALTHQRVCDQYLYRRPATAVWFRVWVRCNDAACNSHVQIESSMRNGAIAEGVKTLVSSWVIDDAVKCCCGHQASQPRERMWAGIVCPGWTRLPDRPR
jgi:hypothetical protein